MVAADDKKKFRTGIAPAKMPNRVNAVRFSPFGDLKTRNLKMTIAAHRQTYHAQTMFGSDQVAPAFMRRQTGWDKNHLIQTELFQNHLGDHQMPDMDRIERAT